MESLHEFIPEVFSVEEINPYVRFANKIFVSPTDVHSCPWRELYDYQLIAVLQGELKFEHEDGRVVAVGENECFLIPPLYRLHEYCEAHTSCIFYIVHFDMFYSPKRTNWDMEEMYLRHCRPWIKEVKLEEKYVDREDRNYHFIREPLWLGKRDVKVFADEFQDMCDIRHGTLGGGVRETEELLQKGCMLKILAQLFLPVNSVKNDQYYFVNEFMDYVLVNYAEKINIGRIADSYGISSNHFRKTFKSYTGKSPSDYILWTRMEKAKELLLRELPVYIVAERVGFEDPYYFSVMFKKTMGVPPSKFQQKSSKKKDV